MRGNGLRVFMESNKKGYRAEGIFDGEGISVRAGSRVCPEMDSLAEALIRLRRMFVDADGVVRRNLYFDTVSKASNFICGRSSNGWVEWRVENGDKLEVYRNGQMMGTQNSKSTEEAGRDSQNYEANMMSSKEKTEKVLERLCRQYPTVSFASMKRHTPVRFKGMIVASIYYRSSEIRVEVQKGDFSMYVYNELAERNIAYQKPSASPDSTPGKYSFFAPVDKAEDVLRTIIKRADGRIMEKYEAPMIVEEGHADASPSDETRPSGTDSQEMIMRDLVRQVAKLQDVVMRQSSVQPTTDPEAQDQDRRYRIAATRHDTLDLKIIRADVPIRNLTFSLTIQAEGEDGISGQYQLFLLDESYAVASDIVDVQLSAGQHTDCRFTLVSKMSRQGKCYLAVRDQRDAEDELLKLIPLDIQILFEADFDI